MELTHDQEALAALTAADGSQEDFNAEILEAVAKFDRENDAGAEFFQVLRLSNVIFRCDDKGRGYAAIEFPDEDVGARFWFALGGLCREGVL